jgi:tetratricopeptide (TPR) repeat protein
MRTAILGLVALTLLIAAEASVAQGIRWASSYDEALKEAKERGVLLLCVLTDSQSGETANPAMLGLYANNGAVQKACGQFVCILGDRGRHNEVKRKIDGEQRSVCPILGNLPCKVHVEIEGILTRKFGDVMIDPMGGVRTPVQWLVDGDEKVVEIVAAGDRTQGFDVLSADELATRLNAAAKKFGPGLSSEQYHQLRDLLAQGDELRQKGDLAGAIGKYQAVLKASPQKKVATVVEAEKRLSEIADVGRKEMAEAQKLIEEKRYGEGMARLQEVAKKYHDTDAEREAKQALESLKQNPEVAKLIEAQARKQAADDLLEEGRVADEKQDYGKALDAYRKCAEGYPDTDSGQAAAKRQAEMEADETIMGAIREAAASKDCTRWLNLAKNFISNNVPDRAKVYLEKVIQTYPGTSYARQAQELLDKLK